MIPLFSYPQYVYNMKMVLLFAYVFVSSLYANLLDQYAPVFSQLPDWNNSSAQRWVDEWFADLAAQISELKDTN